MAGIDDLMTKVSALLERVSLLLGRKTLTQNEEVAWWAGTATGGPNGDGRYPRTDGDGTVRLIASPAAIAALASQGGGSLDRDGVAALPAGDAGNFGGRLLGVANDGVPARFPAPAIVSSMIRGLPALSERVNDIIIPGWSAERQRALGDGSASLSLGETLAGLSGVANPRLTHGAKGDGQQVDDAVTANGSNVIESPQAPFSQLDVGKQIWSSNAGASSTRWNSVITEVINSRQVRTRDAAVFSRDNQSAVWGTDDTVAMQAWLNSLSGYEDRFGKVGLLPDGTFLTKQLKYGTRMAIAGASRVSSALSLIPGGTGAALLEQANTRVTQPVIRELQLLGNKYIVYESVDGLRFVSVNGSDNSLPGLDPEPQFSHLKISGFQRTGFYHANRGSGRAENIDISGCNAYGLVSQGYDMRYFNMVSYGNRLTGFYFGRFGSAGNDLRNWKSYFNGVNPYFQNNGSIKDFNSPGQIGWEDTTNLYLGGHNQISDGRLQESWGPNMVIDSPSSFITDVRFDDTGCVRPRHNTGRAQLLSVRPAILLVGGNCFSNTMNNLFLTTAVHPGENFATHGIYFAPDANGKYPDNNLIELKEEQRIGAWYGTGTGAQAPARFGTDNPAGYLDNRVLVNFDRLLG